MKSTHFHGKAWRRSQQREVSLKSPRESMSWPLTWTHHGPMTALSLEFSENGILVVFPNCWLPMCNLRLVWFKGSEYSNAVSCPFPVTPLRAKLKRTNSTWFRKVQFSHLVVSNSLHGLQHSRPPCPSPTPGACSNSCSIKSVMPSNHLILCCPLSFLP